MLLVQINVGLASFNRFSFYSNPTIQTINNYNDFLTSQQNIIKWNKNMRIKSLRCPSLSKSILLPTCPSKSHMFTFMVQIIKIIQNWPYVLWGTNVLFLSKPKAVYRFVYWGTCMSAHYILGDLRSTECPKEYKNRHCWTRKLSIKWQTKTRENIKIRVHDQKLRNFFRNGLICWQQMDSIWDCHWSDG